ncbi:MAG: molybdate ABC transporter substrate-binding protein [Firmicutes bacterium]|nr:molybdate ABC transporter substrate-binding protein [Bacillota bacterium]
MHEKVHHHQKNLGIYLTLAAAIILLLAGCSTSTAQRNATGISKTNNTATQPSAGTLTIFAAASLTESFQALAEAFERMHPQVHVIFSFAGSQTLATQIEEGAHADLFASADMPQMQRLQEKSLVHSPVVFAHNNLVIIVPKGNPAHLQTFGDLPKANRVLLGVDTVPVGHYALTSLKEANQHYGSSFEKQVLAHVVSREQNVKDIVTKIGLGEADAGIVYATDAIAAKEKVEVIPIPQAMNVVADYPIAVCNHSKEPSLAQQWISFLRSSEAQQELTKYGFSAVKGS